MKHRNRLIIYLILGIFVISGMLLVSYGYMGSDVSGNETAKEFVNLSQILKVKYSGGTENLTTKEDGYFAPGSVLTKTFSIKNTGNVNINYGVKLSDVVNDFERVEDLVYELYLEDTLLITDTFPVYDKVLAYSQTINVGETKNYTLKIIYKESQENQIVDQNKIINAKIDFIQTKNTLSNIKILGNSIQEGTPSPTNSLEIKSVGDITKNIFDVEHILANNPTSTTSLQRTTFDDRDCLKWINGSLASKLRFLQGKFKENTRYTISGNFASSVAAGDLFIKYTDGTSQRFMIHGISGIQKNKFSRFSVTSQANKTVDYLTGTWNSNNYNIYLDINSFQIEEGTLATDYEPFGKYKVPLKVETKYDNLIFKNNYLINDNNKESSNSNYKYTTEYLTVLPSTTYEMIFEGKTSEYYVTIPFYDENKNFISRLSGLGTFSTTPKKITFTTPENCYYIKMSIPNNDYEIKFSQITSIHLNEPLRKIGDYQDSIDFNAGQVTRKIGNVELVNTDNLTIFSNNPYPYICYSLGVDGLVIDDISMSSHFIPQSNFSFTIEGINTYRVLNSPSNKQSRIVFRLVQDGTIVTDLNKVGTFLETQNNNGTPVTFNYVWSDENEKYETIENPFNLYSINPDAEITIDTSVPTTVVKE